MASKVHLLPHLSEDMCSSSKAVILTKHAPRQDKAIRLPSPLQLLVVSWLVGKKKKKKLVGWQWKRSACILVRFRVGFLGPRPIDSMHQDGWLVVFDR